MKRGRLGAMKGRERGMLQSAVGKKRWKEEYGHKTKKVKGIKQSHLAKRGSK